MADATPHPALNPHASHDLPFFITPPGETDVLMICTALFLLAAVIAFGVFYFRLHALPEHVAHKADKIQMEIVSILCLIALFTHEHIFWIVGLILAFIDIPDFGTPLRRIADKMGGASPPPDATQGRHGAATEHAERPDEQPVQPKGAKQEDSAVAASKAAAAAATKKEKSHV
jgi:hypothetical protein